MLLLEEHDPGEIDDEVGPRQQPHFDGRAEHLAGGVQEDEHAEDIGPHQREMDLPRAIGQHVSHDRQSRCEDLRKGIPLREGQHQPGDGRQSVNA